LEIQQLRVYAQTTVEMELLLIQQQDIEMMEVLLMVMADLLLVMWKLIGNELLDLQVQQVPVVKFEEMGLLL